ncbi:hypothetical protein Tco_0968467 [Tanacetum coccineum]
MNGSVSAHTQGWERSSSSTLDFCLRDLDFQCPPSLSSLSDLLNTVLSLLALLLWSCRGDLDLSRLNLVKTWECGRCSSSEPRQSQAALSLPPTFLSLTNDLHFVLFSVMAQGHMIPMVDIARMLAYRGVNVTIVTTPLLASRFKSVIARANEAKLQIQLLELQLPLPQVGLAKEYENFHGVPPLEVLVQKECKGEYESGLLNVLGQGVGYDVDLVLIQVIKR